MILKLSINMNTKHTTQIFDLPYYAGKIIILLVMTFALAGRGYAQNPTTDLDAYYSMFDPQHSKTGFLFNKGFNSPDRVREYAVDSSNPATFVVSSGISWKRLYNSLQKSEVLKTKEKIFPELSKLLAKYSGTDVIPVGIINVDGEYLEP